jgi:hypothetical protein
VELTVQDLFQHVDANVVQVFIIHHQIVIMRSNVQIHVLVNLVMLVHQQIQLAVVMEQFVQKEIAF